MSDFMDLIWGGFNALLWIGGIGFFIWLVIATFFYVLDKPTRGFVIVPLLVVFIIVVFWIGYLFE
ncbi:hypothetical protein Alsa1_CDS0142 [Staphylococcus phage Alsa_1]|nr:hypothetical protein Alsa1_CDS0142 [Staphylococcus phage Alsa_1]